MEPTKQAKPRLISNVVVGESNCSVAQLRMLAQSDPKLFATRVNELVAGGMRMEDMLDLRGAFQALGDVQVPVTMEVMNGVTRSVMASAFPLLVGGLAVAGINEAYEAVPTIGQDLVQDIQDNKKVSVFAAIHSLDKSVERVDEGQDFPEISASEEKVEIRSKRNGRKLSITAEAVEENNVADIVNRINALGEIASDWVEEQTLDRVCDKNGSRTTSAGEPYVYRPNGAGAALFSSTANTPGTRAPSGTRKTNNALVDETDLELARTLLASMKNERGKRISIPINQCILLVPDALVGKASKILNSELVPGTENEVSNWGPRGQYRPTLKSSPKLDDLSTSAWYLGMPKREFRRKWKLRFEYVTLAGDTQRFLDNRIIFQARIAWDVEIGALDYVYWVQNLEGTTYVP